LHTKTIKIGSLTKRQTASRRLAPAFAATFSTLTGAAVVGVGAGLMGAAAALGGAAATAAAALCARVGWGGGRGRRAPTQNENTTDMIAEEVVALESITALLQGGAAVDAKLEVRGALLSFMSRALALLLSFSSVALFLGFISSIHAYVGSRL
jgi:hypothetical protein